MSFFITLCFLFEIATEGFGKVNAGLIGYTQNKKMVGIAAMVGTAAQLFMGMMVDILKVQFAIEDFEAVAGLLVKLLRT